MRDSAGRFGSSPKPWRTRLSPEAGIGHRVAHAVAVHGLRGAGLCSWLADRVSGPPTSARVMVMGSKGFMVDPTDLGEARIFRGVHEREERRVVSLLIKPGDVCVDVGANVGSYSWLFSQLVAESGHVLGFEPSESMFERLMASMGSTANVRLFRCALGADNGEAVLFEVAGHAGKSSLHMASEKSIRTTVSVRRLDDPEFALAGQEIAVLKIDVEGAEAQVLTGAGRILTDQQARAILVESSPEFGSIAFVDELRDLGYHCFIVGPAKSGGRLRFRPNLTSIETSSQIQSQRNVLAVRADALAAIDRFVARND
jgi:FkbM family methyltransferase